MDVTKNGVLSFEVNPTSGTPTLEVKINGTRVDTNTGGNDVQRVVQENTGQSIPGAGNTLTPKVTGNGSIDASDFHLLYKAV